MTTLRRMIMQVQIQSKNNLTQVGRTGEAILQTPKFIPCETKLNGNYALLMGW